MVTAARQHEILNVTELYTKNGRGGKFYVIFFLLQLKTFLIRI